MTEQTFHLIMYLYQSPSQVVSLLELEGLLRLFEMSVSGRWDSALITCLQMHLQQTVTD
jgi:hypothetical protein